MRTITVELGERSYPIYVGRGILTDLPGKFSSHKLSSRIAIVSDRNVASRHLKRLSGILRRSGIPFIPLLMPAGERQKSLSRFNTITAQLLGAGHRRGSAIAAFGGGVVGDVAGFVAANYRRGTPFVQIPTTLLGQVESALGGKVGVNHPLAKNAVGTFYQPKFVFSDIDLLLTLTPRELICGLGEVLKYAILDAGIYAFIDAHLDSIVRLDPEILEETVVRCNMLKAAMISEDERETRPEGGRMVLNLGHRIGHVLEELSNFRLHHGEAVVVGLRWELAIARAAGVIDKPAWEEINRLLERIAFRPDLGFIRMDSLIGAIFGREGKARFVLPAGLGKVTTTDSLQPRLVRSVLKSLVPAR
jgi:3-dehydroquinate synthase